VVVQFHPDFAGDHFFDLPELRRVRNLLKRSTRGLRFTGSSTRGIAARLEELLEAKPVARLAGLLEILEVLAASRTVETLSSPEGHGHVRAIDEARIARACAHVAANASDAIRLGTVAALVGMSSASFCRYFKCHTGRTFVEYLNEYRVGMACRMLLETDASITEIAFDSGFSNLSNFNRRFKRVKQMTPRAYRIAYLAS
jgi:AraC-like DNA-binding protein